MDTILPISAMQLHMQLKERQRSLIAQQRIALRCHGLDEVSNMNEWSIPMIGQHLSPEVKVKLHNRELWQQFHAEMTEMIITKLGRRMFPSLQLNISGLQKRAHYYILVEMIPISSRRYKYSGNSGSDNDVGNKNNNLGGWTAAGPAEQQPRLDRRIYFHPDSPAVGAHWMQHVINFNRLKVTNNTTDHHNNVILTSMHKYIPKIWIFRCDRAKTVNELYSHPSSAFIFQETEFIAVTAYQNQLITKLKINNNPFAKGFRETGQSRCKRKSQINTDRSNQMDDENDKLFESESGKRKTSSPEINIEDIDSRVDVVGDHARQLSRIIPVQNSSSTSKDDSRNENSPRFHRPWLDTPLSFSQKSNLPTLLPPLTSHVLFTPSSYPIHFYQEPNCLQNLTTELQQYYSFLSREVYRYGSSDWYGMLPQY